MTMPPDDLRASVGDAPPPSPPRVPGPIPPGYDVPEGYVPPQPPTEQPPRMSTAPAYHYFERPPAPPAYLSDPRLMYPHAVFRQPLPQAPVPPPGSVQALSQPSYGVTPLVAVQRLYRKYAVFSGRASRSEFWWAQGFAGLVFLGLFVVIGIVGNADPSGQGAGSLVAGLAVLVLLLFGAGTLLPLLGLSVRRLHDADLHGAFWCLSFIPYVGSLIVLILNMLPSRDRGARFDVMAVPVYYELAAKQP